MNDLHYEIIDALYFTLDFRALLQESGLEEEALKKGLTELHEKGLVKHMPLHRDEELGQALCLDDDFWSYRYLATKKGLMAHNNML